MDRKFDNPTIYIRTLQSIHQNHNIVWDNQAHLLMLKMHFPIISSIKECEKIHPPPLKNPGICLIR